MMSLRNICRKTVMLTMITGLGLFLSACTAFSSREVTVSEASRRDAKAYFHRQLFNPDCMSADSENFLRGNLLMSNFEDNPAEILLRIDEFYEISRDPCYYQIAADLCRYAAEKTDDEEKKVSSYLSAIYYCRMALYCAEKNESNWKKDFSSYRLVMIYNDACSGIFRYLKEKKLLSRQSFSLQDLEGRRYSFVGSLHNLSVPEEYIKDLSLCSDYTVDALQQTTRRSGLGIPLIAHVANKQLYHSLKTPENLTIPVTFMIKMDDRSPREVDVTLAYQDTTLEETLKLVPQENDFSDTVLSLDFSTPLAYFLNSQPEKNLLISMLNPRDEEENVGLYMLEPYNPHKIPVVFVHGLMSSPNTWVQMINSLKNDPTIRKRYQFWFFAYSSGAPVVSSAGNLRKALYEAQKEFCTTPETIANFNKMVLIGHSMGGLVSRTLLQKDKYYIVETVTEQSWKDLTQGLTKEDVKQIEDIAVFPPLPFVHRVVFLSVPHEGSDMAKWSIARLGASLTKLPDSMIKRVEYYKDLFIRMGKGAGALHLLQAKVNTGIDNLDPDNPFVRAISTSKMKDDLVYHSIIGNQENDNCPGGSDGVVPYTSSHLDHAASELVVKSGHSVHRTPGAIREVLRILLLHLNESEKTK